MMLDQFLAMGGYAAYVWPAYGVTLALLLAMYLVSRGELRAAEQRLGEIEGLRRARRGGGVPEA